MGTPFFGRVSRFFMLGAMIALAACEAHSTEVPLPPDFNDTGPGPSPNPGGSTTPKGLFLTSVGPPLQQACADCHAHADSGAPVFMGESAEATYVLFTFTAGIIAPPVNSILTHQGPHAGPALTAELSQSVDAWLLQEMQKRGVGPVGLPSLETGMASIGHCMTMDDFKANGLDALSQLDASGKGKCSDCHAKGAGGAFLSDDATETIAKSGSVPFINRWVHARIGDAGSSVDFEPSKAWVSTGSAACDAQKYDCHPAYQIPDALATGINTFVNATLDRWHSTKCGAL